MRSPFKTGLALIAGCAVVLAGCSSGEPQEPENEEPTSNVTEQEASDTQYGTREITDGTTTFIEVQNPGDGTTLSYSTESGFELIEEEVDGVTYAFKDMNGNGVLDTWEDWRLDPAQRAADLAPQLSIEQIAGLMLFSSHERSPSDGLTPAQREYLSESHLRTVLNAGPNDVEENVTWANQLQAFVETLASGETPYVPVSVSSDPRSDARDSYSGAVGGISQWPSTLGLAATFDPERVLEFGKIASEEYRALGISNALSPQIDLATEPRWLRVNGTFGEEADMTAEMAAAYVEGFQTTYDEDGNAVGWGQGSVATMIKHYPGDGAGEGGRESHTDAGKFAVIPGGNFEDHLKPFEAALDSAGLMTSYSILTDGEGNPLFGDELVGTAYDYGRMELLRDQLSYDGVVVTDWSVLRGGPGDPASDFGTAWGVAELTVAERIMLALSAGVDSFGGHNEVGPVLEAHGLWQEAYEAGDIEVDADTRFQQTGARVLTMLLKGGLYENPFQDLDHSIETVGKQEYTDAGWQAQLDSVVVLKNTANAIECSPANPYADATVYIPQTYNTGFDGRFGPAEYVQGPSLDTEAAEQYFGTVVTDEVELDDDGKVVSYTAPDLTDVDVVFVGMESVDNGDNFSNAGLDTETGEYYPLSLQYRPYTADGENVRRSSIAGDVLEDGSTENRSYFGNTSRIANEADLDAFERAVEAVEASGQDIPVIVALSARNPVIPAEFEDRSDAIVVGMGVSDAAMIEVALGLHESAGRLPITFPADMDTVEANEEDVAFDLDPYVDSAGNAYDFGFGLSCDATTLQ